MIEEELRAFVPQDGFLYLFIDHIRDSKALANILLEEAPILDSFYLYTFLQRKGSHDDLCMGYLCNQVLSLLQVNCIIDGWIIVIGPAHHYTGAAYRIRYEEVEEYIKRGVSGGYH